MDGCNKCCEINTVFLTCELSQVVPWNNDTVKEKMDGWKWCRHITDFFQCIHVWKQEGIIISIIISMPLLQFLFCKINLKEWVAAITLFQEKKFIHRVHGWNWTCELTLYLWKKDNCKCLFKRNTVPMKILDHCKWPPETMMVQLKCMAAISPLK